jgi:hypothetical protein
VGRRRATEHLFKSRLYELTPTQSLSSHRRHPVPRSCLQSRQPLHLPFARLRHAQRQRAAKGGAGTQESQAQLHPRVPPFRGD